MSIDLYASVAGINAFFNKMDVTAHNVANLNTDNYKNNLHLRRVLICKSDMVCHARDCCSLYNQ